MLSGIQWATVMPMLLSWFVTACLFCRLAALQFNFLLASLLGLACLLGFCFPRALISLVETPTWILLTC